jgi:processive 1,2-diacylglycerol beta-glucosyltransferase
VKKRLLVLFCFCTSVFFANTEISDKKGKIVVLTSRGGNGHMSACNVLEDIFPDFQVKFRYPIYEYFHNAFDGEAWYSSMFQSGWTRAVNFIVRYPASIFFNLAHKTFQRRFVRMLEQEKPDILISVIPFLNSPAASAAERLKIPFLLITLDADLDTWLLNFNGNKNKNFVATVQVKTDRIKKQLARKHIPESCVYEVGRPLRKDFFTPKNVAVIRKEWNIPENKKVIMLMRGGTGSDKMVDYVRTLVKLNEPMHLLVCIGGNTTIIRKLNKIKNSGPVSFSVIKFTPKISDLMAVSDLLITQPSPNVCNEAMHMRLPILVDMTSKCLFWEEATIDWIKLLGDGHIFKRMKDLNRLVLQNLDKKRELAEQKAQNSPLPFNKNIRKIVTGMLAS